MKRKIVGYFTTCNTLKTNLSGAILNLMEYEIQVRQTLPINSSFDSLAKALIRFASIASP